jgi:hypothetical protein
MDLKRPAAVLHPATVTLFEHYFKTINMLGRDTRSHRPLVVHPSARGQRPARPCPTTVANRPCRPVAGHADEPEGSREPSAGGAPVAGIYAVVISGAVGPPTYPRVRQTITPRGHRVPAPDLAFLGADAAFGYASRVEPRGLEPLTPTLPVLCAPSRPVPAGPAPSPPVPPTGARDPAGTPVPRPRPTPCPSTDPDSSSPQHPKPTVHTRQTGKLGG